MDASGARTIPSDAPTRAPGDVAAALRGFRRRRLEQREQPFDNPVNEEVEQSRSKSIRISRAHGPVRCVATPSGSGSPGATYFGYAAATTLSPGTGKFVEAGIVVPNVWRVRSSCPRLPRVRTLFLVARGLHRGEWRPVAGHLSGAGHEALLRELLDKELQHVRLEAA